MEHESGSPLDLQRKEPQLAQSLTLQGRQRRWYAVYTCSRREKQVANQLERRAIETYLPTYETIRRWKNGRHRVQVPLFPGYALVRIAFDERLAVLKVPGVARIVGFNGSPTPLADSEIENIRRVLDVGLHPAPYPYLTSSRKVRIKTGPLAGCSGILVRRKGRSRLILSVDLILRSVAVDIEASDVEPV